MNEIYNFFRNFAASIVIGSFFGESSEVVQKVLIENLVRNYILIPIKSYKVFKTL